MESPETDSSFCSRLSAVATSLARRSLFGCVPVRVNSPRKFEPHPPSQDRETRKRKHTTHNTNTRVQWGEETVQENNTVSPLHRLTRQPVFQFRTPQLTPTGVRGHSKGHYFRRSRQNGWLGTRVRESQMTCVRVRVTTSSEVVHRRHRDEKRSAK